MVPVEEPDVVDKDAELAAAKKEIAELKAALERQKKKTG